MSVRAVGLFNFLISVSHLELRVLNVKMEKPRKKGLGASKSVHLKTQMSGIYLLTMSLCYQIFFW